MKIKLALVAALAMTAGVVALSGSALAEPKTPSPSPAPADQRPTVSPSAKQPVVIDPAYTG
ncbi:hypothetical protein OIE66_38080 [Nonomuraea sp. NBC_01738]|uniref:hypothetical protein n=1 Tax=Nonomuraea sp. NBC_01738 TaxID=2976003 RepID=UPI002E13199C|nr:hypothetical protein OIE66_38080 [Nonomuraea sp. NBC_01738]